jgi:hypothetical protein
MLKHKQICGGGAVRKHLQFEKICILKTFAFEKICIRASLRIRASLHRLRKKSASNRFWEGHDFSRAAKPSKIGRALAPEVGFLPPKQVFPQPVQRCRNTGF